MSERCPFCDGRLRRNLCRGCDAEEFIEDSVPGVDTMMREPVTRFGESVTADDTDHTQPAFDPNRFAESIEDPEDDTDEDA